MTDIVERLRTSVTKGHEPSDADAIEAADEIERLRAKLRSELEGKISQSYAAELARQVGELETENERLREELRNPIMRRMESDRFGISICWDDHMISGLQKSTDEVWRLVKIDKMLRGEYPDLHAHLAKIADQMLKLIERTQADRRYDADAIEELRRDFPDLFTKVV